MNVHRSGDYRGTARRREAHGFTLIELMIGVAILGILLSIAVPAYSEFLVKARRDDGRALLQLNAQRLQRCFTLQGVYDGTVLDGAGGSEPSCVLRSVSAGGYYTLDAMRTETTYLLSAVPVAGRSQASDAGCGSLTYAHTGKRGASTGSAACW